METAQQAYTVKQLAQMAGVSVRTLHYYDQIKLLKPSNYSDSGYRLYGKNELLRLQQILFFKELNFPLNKIRDILDDPEFDTVAALHKHRLLLQKQSERMTLLLKTVDKTIQKLTENNMSMTDEELYAGFTREQIDRYEREVEEKYDPKLVKESKRRLGKMSKQQWQGVKDEGGEVTQLIANLADRAPEDGAVQALIARHHAWIENFYPASANVYRGLGDMYATQDEFRAFYEKFRPGLADFMKAAMVHYADHVLAK
jgi:DNA-binding transcriptional MerR regulator